MTVHNETQSPSRPILLLPGIGNSGPKHWQSLWEGILPSATRVEQSNWEQPRCDEWCAGIEKAVQCCTTAPIVVAHSLGCLALAHWAERSSHGLAGALLVAVPDPTAPSFPAQAEGFAPVPLRPMRLESILAASSNDPYASLEFTERCAQAWRSRLVWVGAHGHINAESGLGHWEAGLALLTGLEQSCFLGLSGLEGK